MNATDFSSAFQAFTTEQKVTCISNLITLAGGDPDYHGGAGWSIQAVALLFAASDANLGTAVAETS